VTTTSAYLTLADLAGSEGASATTSRDQRLEAANINRSLLTLGKVIWELGRAKGAGGEAGGGEVLGAHVPFRDSLLTRLLKVSGSARSLLEPAGGMYISGCTNMHSGVPPCSTHVHIDVSCCSTNVSVAAATQVTCMNTQSLCTGNDLYSLHSLCRSPP
jgi:hypothetical protein